MNPDPASLDRLHDVIIPAPVPWWPPAPGWYWILAIGVVVVLYGLCAALIIWQRNAYRREAMAEWRQCDALLAKKETRSEALDRLAALVKRVALSVSPRAQVASLTGSEWSTFLDQRGSDRALGERLEGPAYDSASAASLGSHQLQSLSNDVKTWIQQRDNRLKGGR